MLLELLTQSYELPKKILFKYYKKLIGSVLKLLSGLLGLIIITLLCVPFMNNTLLIERVVMGVIDAIVMTVISMKLYYAIKRSGVDGIKRGMKWYIKEVFSLTNFHDHNIRFLIKILKIIFIIMGSIFLYGVTLYLRWPAPASWPFIAAYIFFVLKGLNKLKRLLLRRVVKRRQKMASN